MAGISTQPYKGTRDFYPEEMALRRKLFNQFAEVARLHAFQEYGGPLLEPFDLYAAKTGEEIVKQQLYNFVDRGGRNVAIRPEMTPTLARMVAAKIGELQIPLRWYSVPNLYRYERPQKGRLREHWQFNADILGGESFFADFSILNLLVDFFEGFACLDKIKIRLNHRAWVDHFTQKVLGLDAIQSLAFSKILDAKEKKSPEDFESELKAMNLSAKQVDLIQEYLNFSFEEIFSKYSDSPLVEVKKVLEELGRPELFHYDPLIMRGLDYYTGLVFEGFDNTLSNKRALFGGGRYDNLMALFGKQALSGIGFGMGDVVLMDFLTENALIEAPKAKCDIFVSLAEESFWKDATLISKILRKKNLSVQVSLKSGNFKKQLKEADKSGALFAVLFGEEEWKEKKIILRNMKNSTQEILFVDELISKTF
jgi:histidyl-tRNA synthetase